MVFNTERINTSSACLRMRFHESYLSQREIRKLHNSELRANYASNE